MALSFKPRKRPNLNKKPLLGRQKLRVLLKIFLAVLIVFSFLYLSGSVINSVKIENINCKSQFGKCNQALEENLISLKGKGLGETKADINFLLKTDLLVKNYSIHYRPPNTIFLDVLERNPVSAIYSPVTGAFAQADEEGFIVSVQEGSNLPYIVVDAPLPAVGDKLDEETLYCLSLARYMFFLYKVRSGKKDAESIYFEGVPTRGYKVIFPLSGDKERLLGALILILTNLESDSQLKQDAQTPRIDDNIAVIDLRFKNPILK